MAAAPPSPPRPRYEPEPRYGHCSALVEGKWITYMYDGVRTDGGLADRPTSVDVFDPDREEWTQMTTSGTPPSGVMSAACVSVGPLLYHIGGSDDTGDGGRYNTVHCLDTTTMEWRELQPANTQAAPMKKLGLAGISYGNVIVTVGGFGDLPTNRHPGVEYVPDPESEGRGWTNEVVCYDTEQNMWFRPTITGSAPPACQLCSLTRVDHHRAVLFGGQGKDGEPISPDVYILDMNHWTWTVIPASQPPNHPVGRYGHSSISVYDPDADPTHPALLIMWGYGDEVLRDSWIFDLNQQQWKMVILPGTLMGRFWHTSVVIHSSPKIRIICFGGVNILFEDGDIGKAVPIAQTTTVELSCSGGHPAEWIVIDVSQLGEGDRLPTHIKLTMGESQSEEIDAAQSTSAQATDSAVWTLPGVVACGETSVVLHSSQGQLFEWNGLKLYIHAGSLPEGLEQCTIFIKASLAGEYEIPENTSLVSGIFWLRCEPQCTFIKPIMVEIQHCSTKRDLSKLKIVRAFCNQKSLPYKFKPLGGSFNADTFYGAIDMKGFSGVGVVDEKPDSERMYYNQLFYRSHLSDQQRHEIHIIFVWNTELHLNHLSRQYPTDSFLAGCHRVIEIEGEVIEVVLDAVTWTKVMNGQWEIQPAQPKVTKAELDDFKPGRGLPSCVLEVRPLCEDYPQLLHQIILNGVKPPHHEIILSYMPSRMNRYYPSGASVQQSQSPPTVQMPVDVSPRQLAFSEDMSCEQLSLWLRNHHSLSGADYEEDISKLRVARINGHIFLTLDESRLQRFSVSVGFEFAIMNIIKDMLQKSSHQPPSSERLPLQQQSSRSNVATPRTTQHQLSSSTAGQQTTPGCLGQNDLRRVQDTLWEARAQWYNLGLGLDITPDSLDSIKLDNVSTNDCFRAMLTKWLREHQRPTWSALAEALRSPSVGLSQLAEEIILLQKQTIKT